MADLLASVVAGIVRRINSGEVQVCPSDPETPWGYCGVVTFETPCGWRFAVFNDCDEFDYFEWAESPDGARWAYEHDAPDTDYFKEIELLAQEIDSSHRERWGIDG